VYNSDSILQAVSKELKIDMKILFSAIRVKEVCYARSLAMYLCYNLGGMNYVEIGQKFGRNHSTVISSINKIEKMMQSDKAILCHIANVKALLKMI
jgi:chromosomal replication initiator protein